MSEVSKAPAHNESTHPEHVTPPVSQNWDAQFTDVLPTGHGWVRGWMVRLAAGPAGSCRGDWMFFAREDAAAVFLMALRRSVNGQDAVAYEAAARRHPDASGRATVLVSARHLVPTMEHVRGFAKNPGSRGPRADLPGLRLLPWRYWPGFDEYVEQRSVRTPQRAGVQVVKGAIAYLDWWPAASGGMGRYFFEDPNDAAALVQAAVHAVAGEGNPYLYPSAAVRSTPYHHTRRVCLLGLSRETPAREVRADFAAFGTRPAGTAATRWWDEYSKVLQDQTR